MLCTLWFEIMWHWGHTDREEVKHDLRKLCQSLIGTENDVEVV